MTEMKKTFDTDEVEIWEGEWGDMHVSREVYHQDMDTRPLLKGLPDDRCQSQHWGYVLRGTMRVLYADREEEVAAGNPYYLAPGHAVLSKAGTELIEFSPSAAFQKTIEVITRNFEALQGSASS